MNNTTILDHQSTYYGGAIFVFGNTTTNINGSTISNNISPTGGGVLIYGGGLLSISESEISDNTASNDGGGVNVGYGAELNISDSLFSSNHAGRKGGGLFKDSGSVKLATTISGTTFLENTADWSGGGVFIWRTPLTITGSEFTDNHADEYGGGLGYQDWNAFTNLISDTTFSSNVAGWDGGAIHFSGEQMSVNNCTIQDNTAINGAGIHNGPTTDSRYISRPDTSLTITGGDVQENVASTSGGGVFQ